MQRLPHAEPVRQPRGLQLRAEQPPQPVALMRRIKAEHRELATFATAETLKDLHGRRLAGAVAARDAKDLVGFDRERDVSEHWLSVV